MAKVELKQPIVDEIASTIQDAQAVVLVNYSGLTVEQDTIMRRELRESGITYKVFKNTMMRRAFEGTPCEALDAHLNGTNALAVSTDDATAPARILAKYAKQYPALELVAGVVEGQYNDQAGIQALSQVPSREELLAKLFGSMQAPIANMARVLKQIAEKGGEAAPAQEAAPAEEAAPAAE
jgi:large subunit ribosomal protein L10